MKFTLGEVLKANGYNYNNVPANVKENLKDLIDRINKIGYPKPAYVSSGYRDPEHNACVGGAKNSYHCQGKAIDIKDPGNKIKAFIMANQGILKELGLRMERPEDTNGWCHLDSGKVIWNRIFRAK